MDFISQFFNGLQLGSIYALVALGYTMVYGIAKLINFAHGDIIMVGGYTVFLAIGLPLFKTGLPLWLAVVPAVIVCTLLGVLIERVAYKPLRNSSRISLLITTIGVSLFLQNLFVKIFTSNAKPLPALFPQKSLSFGDVHLSLATVITIISTIILTYLLNLFVNKTKYGKAMLAVSEDYGAAELVGINVNQVMTMTFAIGSALAGVASVLYVASYPQIQPFMGSMLGIKAFTAAVLGGIGSIPGAVVGGLILGIIEVLTRAYLSSAYADAIVFVILILVLLIQPNGLFGKLEKEKVWYMSTNKKKTYLITTALVILFFVIIQGLIGGGIINRYWQNILILICINIIMSTSLNLTVGVLGQINLGHAGFMAIGAYAAALFLKSGLVGGFLGYFLSLIIAGVVATVFGILIGLPVLRLTGDYLAIVTLAFGEIIRVLIENLSFTGGAQGLAGIPTTHDFGKYFLVAAFLVTMIFTYASCRHGRAVLSIRDNELAAESCGINITKYKTFAFALSALFAGVAGALYAQSFGVLAANIFNYNKSFDYLVMVVLGGMGSMTGAIFSTIGLTILPEVLKPMAEWRMVIYAVILIAVMIYRPQGLLGRKEFSLRKLLNIGKYKKGDVEGE